MTQKNTGGPAFPGKVNVPDMEDVNTGEALTFREEDHPGMTLRDYFAANALIKWSEMITLQVGNEDGNKTQMKVVAEICYAFADAMIEAREK